MDGPRRAGSDSATTGVVGAVNLLEEVDHGRHIHLLAVVTLLGRAARAEEARSFPRLVTLLGEREGRRALRRIEFLVDWQRLPREDVERLFRDVLPAHTTLESISVNVRRLPARFLRFLTDAVPTNPHEWLLSGMQFFGGVSEERVDEEIFQAIVDMMNRNVALATLRVEATLDAHQCKLICQSLPRNRNLLHLTLRVTEVFADSLDGVAASSLQHLAVHGSYSKDAVSTLARQLRTNETLETLQVDARHGRGRRDSKSLLELVSTYNYALHTIGGNLGSLHGHARVREQFGPLARRNGRIRAAIARLQDPDPNARRAVPNHQLPLLLGLASDVPTALFRILRMGYVNAVRDLVAAAQVRASMTTTTTTTTTIVAAASVEAGEPRRGQSPPLAKRRRMAGEDQNASAT